LKGIEMSDDFGAELKSIRVVAGSLGRDPVQADDVSGPGLDVSAALESVISEAGTALHQPFFGASRGFILYFPPGRYALPGPGALAYVYDLPENLQLYFAPGALLRPSANVVLIIRGAIRAGKHQIFGYDRYVPTGIPGIITRPAGRTLLHSNVIPSELPNGCSRSSRRSTANRVRRTMGSL
jgi:hypothetical protein